MEDNTPGTRVREVRKRRGITQRELASMAGVALSTVKRIEQGIYGPVRVRMTRKLAVALDVPTSALMTGPDAPVATLASVQRWGPVAQAIDGITGDEPEGEPDLEGIRQVLAEVTPLLMAGRFAESRLLVPGLLRDARALAGVSADGELATARAALAQVLQAAGALMLHTWQFSAAEKAFAMAMEEAPDALTAMSVADERCWGLIRQGRIAEARELAFGMAAEHEPSMSGASRDELAQWGRLLIRGAMAAVRDNRADEAAEGLRLARMAAAGCGTDFVASHSWHVFGPTAVAVFTAESAMIQDRPDTVLAIGRRLGRARLPSLGNALLPYLDQHAPSFRLDVAAALAAKGKYAESVGVLQHLRRARPQWLPQQRYAADTLQVIIDGRRSLTDEMRDLADAMKLPV